MKETERITFQEIQKANETIKTTDIKGKEYAEVNQRIKAYRMVYPNGTIRTKLAKLENGICVFMAEVTNNDGDVIATGTAYEKENSTFINKTSYIENCETSAVGRALGMAGFGIDTSVASAEEVANAIKNQEKETRTKKSEEKKELMIIDSQKEKIKELYTAEEIKTYLVLLKKSKLSELTLKEASDFIRNKSEEIEGNSWKDMQD